MKWTPHFGPCANQAIRIEDGGSGDPWQTGWYKEMLFDPSDGLKFDPTIADVHTDPGGPFPVSRGPSVLHVGTGLPRPMVVSVQTCEGPRAYAGVVFAYHERQEAGFTRPTDNQWQEMLTTSAQADVGWLEPALGPPRPSGKAAPAPFRQSSQSDASPRALTLPLAQRSRIAQA